MRKNRLRKMLLSAAAAGLAVQSIGFPAVTAYSGTGNAEASASNKFIFGEDNWQFINSSKCFGDKYFLTDSDHKVLEESFSNIEQRIADTVFGSDFGGSCYGMAALSVLACNDLVDYSKYTEGASSIYTMTDLSSQYDRIPDNIASLCNYYFILQCTDEITQYAARSMINMTAQERLQKLIDNAEKEIPTFLAYTYPSRNGMRSGHAVVAVSAEYGDYELTIRTASGDEELRNYNGRIRIYDNAAKETENRYLYFNTEDMSWYYNGVSSEKDGLLSVITSDTNLLNNKGLIGGTEYKDNSDFIALLYSDPVEPESSVSKISYSDGKWKTTQSAESEIREFPTFLGGEVSFSSRQYTLTDAKSGYVMDIEEPADLSLCINYENSYIGATATAGNQVVFHPSGYGEITGENTDYELELIFNDEYYSGSWFDISVTGTAGNTSVRKTDEGYIITSDNMKGTVISASGDDVSASCSVSYTDDSLLMYEINERTIGLAADTDSDGVYETKKKVRIIGDANQDGNFNVRDAAFIAKKLAEGKGKELSEISDYNGDRIVNIRDGAAIARYLAEKK